jgi:hypothetical protein
VPIKEWNGEKIKIQNKKSEKLIQNKIQDFKTTFFSPKSQISLPVKRQVCEECIFLGVSS